MSTSAWLMTPFALEVINVAVGADRPGDRALTAVRPVQVADQAPDGGARKKQY